MQRKEAFLIAEEILRMIVFPNSHFQENMREYICDKLDISDESLTEVLNIISKEPTTDEKLLQTSKDFIYENVGENIQCYYTKRMLEIEGDRKKAH